MYQKNLGCGFLVSIGYILWVWVWVLSDSPMSKLKAHFMGFYHTLTYTNLLPNTQIFRVLITKAGGIHPELRENLNSRSILALKASKEGASFTSTGKSFQRGTTLLIKKFSLTIQVFDFR